MDEIEIFLRMAFVGLGLILAALTFFSWYKTREMKIMLAAFGFGTLAAEGILLAAGIFSEVIEDHNSILAMVSLNFLAMLFLYVSILKR